MCKYQRYCLMFISLSLTTLACQHASNTNGNSSAEPQVTQTYVDFENLLAPVTSQNLSLLHDIQPRSADGTVNAVVEIPAGSNQKWEVHKTTGNIEWEQISDDSLRIVQFLPYPANYGFIPRTLLPLEAGGDGDPLDVFVLGPSARIGSVLGVRILGGIHMIDDGEQDDKLIAVDLNSWFANIHTIEQLNSEYPGIVDILNTFLLNYKGPENTVTISGILNHEAADAILNLAINEFIE